MRPTTQPADAATALLASIAGGDRDAFGAFYDEFHARVYAFALRRLRNAADAADVMNEVMLEVWRNAARFEQRSKPSTWVLGIAQHKIVDLLRRRRPKTAEDCIECIEHAASDDSAADDALAVVHDAQTLRRCLEQLSDAHALVLHLAFFEDLSYSEIAEITGCPPGTVKTRAFHAKRLLKHCLTNASLNYNGTGRDPTARPEESR